MESRLNTSAEKRVVFWRDICGCQAGAICALAGLAWYIFAYEHATVSALGVVLRGAGMMIAAGVIGKAAALAVARIVLRTLPSAEQRQELTR